jgi:hypothetical protein
MSNHLRLVCVALASSCALISVADALVTRAPSVPGALEATPAAMCGNSCRNGGRYFPGPPSVCAEEGLNYCGSSRGGYSPRRDYEERGPGYAFDEREYLRCNPDVRRAVNRGQQESGFVHYQTIGRRERRPLTC